MRALAEQAAKLAGESGTRVATAESLTGGMVSSALAAAPDASSWFRGGVVAYSSEVKHDLLDVPDVPVVSAEAAITMAASARRLLGADVAIALTGVGGPDPQDGRSPGTVYLAVSPAPPGGAADDAETDERGSSVLRHFDDEDDPAAVCQAAGIAALELLVRALDGR